jgi:hypothetical protein
MGSRTEKHSRPKFCLVRIYSPGRSGDIPEYSPELRVLLHWSGSHKWPRGLLALALFEGRPIIEGFVNRRH